MIAVALLVIAQGAAPPLPPTQICVDIAKPASTSSTSRRLTLSERDIYRIAERGAAVARGWKVEADRCADVLKTESKRADDAESRLIYAPPIAPPADTALSVPWLEIGGAAVGAVAGAYSGDRVSGSTGAAVGAGLGAIGGAGAGLLLRLLADEVL